METIGANTRFCPVVDMAYTVFEWERFVDSPYTFVELVASVKTVKLSIVDQMQNYGCSFKKEDVVWWEACLPILICFPPSQTAAPLPPP